MIKRVKVEQLKPGMYIHDMNCGWMENPFFSKSLKVSGDDVVKKIMDQGLREVYIDTKKGSDVKNAVPEEEVKKVISEKVEKIAEEKPKPAEKPKPPVQKAEKKEQYKPPKGDYDPNEGNKNSVKEEMKVAKQIQSEAKEVVDSMMDDVRLGKQVDTEKSAEVVEKMVESVFRNKDALASLGRIKSADLYTFQHSVSVGVLMISFCKAIGIDKDEIKKVGQGAMLHDIGKMKVPNEILNKPGKLTDEEFATMKGHALESMNILSKTDGISEQAVEVAGQHHERFDGTGYPFRLKGDDIGVYGQMSAIVDVYDAITSNRCYHKGMDSSEALKKIFEWSKFHFNRSLVQKYIRTIGIYPVGSLVKLKSGYIGVVVEPGTKDLMLPTVRLVYSLKNQDFLYAPKDKNLGKSGGNDAILSNEAPEQWGIDPLEFLDLDNM